MMIVFNKKGIGLIEFVISSSVGLIGLLIVSQVFISSVKHTKKTKIILTMQNINSIITTSLFDLDFFKPASDNKNYIKNNVVYRCFGKPTVCNFNQGSSKKIYPLKIFDINGNQWSGVDSEPKYFDEYGSSCLELSSNCPIRVVSTMKVGCPESSISCSGMKINEVFITYSISAPPQYSKLNIKNSVISKTITVPVSLKSTATSERIYKEVITENIINTLVTRTINYGRNPSSSGGDGDGGGNSGGNSGGCDGEAPDGCSPR